MPVVSIRPSQKRVDALEAFYVSHVEDERSVLFEKQRLRLRKLLAEYEGIGPGELHAGLCGVRAR